MYSGGTPRLRLLRINGEAMATILKSTPHWRILSLVLALSVLAPNARATSVSGLFDAERQTRITACDRLSIAEDPTAREEIIHELIDILSSGQKDSSFEGTLHLSIRVLGALKAETAIPAMLPYFTFVPGGLIIIRESMPTQWYYPTAVAFTEIGSQVIIFL